MTRLLLSLSLLAAFVGAQTLDPALLAKPLGDAWPTYSGDYSGKRYSTLKQINQSNVQNLTLAWTMRINAGNRRSQEARLVHEFCVYRPPPRNQIGSKFYLELSHLSTSTSMSATDDIFLVIGGCGFLGSHIINGLIARGTSKLAIFDIAEPRKSISNQVLYVKGDLTNYEQLDAAFKSVGPIFRINSLY